MNYREINTTKTFKDDILTIETEFGHKLSFKIIPSILIDIENDYDDGLPDFSSNVKLEFIKIETNPKTIPQEEIKEIYKLRSIIPSNLEYDHVLLGFVYAEKTDPTNHKWWLDFRDSFNKSVFSYFSNFIDIECQISTKSWNDGIWHGRYVFAKKDIGSILEKEPGKLIISGVKNIEQIQNSIKLPEKTSYLRLRYNIREDFWNADIMSSDHKQIDTLIGKNIITTAKMKTHILSDSKPKVSTRVDLNDIGDVGILVNTIIIQGKY